MSAPILTTKLYRPPPRPDLMARPRLLKRMMEMQQRGACFTLVSAPAGFGKTTLVSQWLAEGDQAVVWFSLDENDNDPARFLTYLIAALQQLDPQLGEATRSGLHSPQPPPMETLLALLLNDLAGFAHPFSLVLDDYHIITTPAIHEILTWLVDNHPPLMHLIITSRVDPPLPLARLRARRQLTELRAADLRLTPAEAATFLQQVMGLSLTPADVAALEARTEGWLAGLQLAALSMQGVSDLPGFIKSFTGSHRHIVDYLAEEVLQRQPETIQTFLLQTSILDRVCGPLANALLEQPSPAGASASFSAGQQLLEYLDQANLFIVPLDNERRWYRYHQLFADLLRHRLQQTQVETLPELHQRASHWFQENGYTGEAIRHALAAHDPERAAQLIEPEADTIVSTMLIRAELPTLRGWLQALPESILQKRPRLLLAQAWVDLISAQTEADLAAAAALLPVAEAAIAASPQPADLAGQELVLRGYLAFVKGETAETVRLAQQARQALATNNQMLRGITWMIQGSAHWLRGEVTAATTAYTQTTQIGQQLESLYLQVVGLNNQANIAIEQGRLLEADWLYQEALHRVQAEGQQPLLEQSLYTSLAELWREWNRLEEGETHLTAAIALGQRVKYAELVLTASVILARIKHSQGEAEAALATIEQAQRLLQSHQLSPLAAWVAAVRARLLLGQGQVLAARQWAQACGLELANEAAYQRFPGEYTTLARVWLAQTDEELWQTTLQLLRQMQTAFTQTERTGRVIEVLVLQALALDRLQRRKEALATLAEALLLAEPGGYIRLFVDEGQPLAELVLAVRGQLAAVSRAYLQRLLDAFGQEPVGFPAAAGQELGRTQTQSLIEPLSDRELEVLQLVAEGYSNREIADKLVISFGTVRKHVENIRGKLGVSSRLQAVNRARELGLLENPGNAA